MAPSLLFVCLCLQAPVPPAALKLEAEFTWGVQGPKRDSARFAPRDRANVSFRVDGLCLDKLGRANCLVWIELRRPNGAAETLHRRETGAVNLWKGTTLRSTFNLPLDLEQTPGQYALIISAADRHSGQEAKAELPFEVEPRGFALLGPLFFADPQGQSACPPEGVCGQTLYLKLGVVGHGVERGKSRASCKAEVLDAAGQPLHELVSEPLTLAAPVLSFDVALPLLRPGAHFLRLTVTDEAGGGAVRTVTTPLKVREP